MTELLKPGNTKAFIALLVVYLVWGTTFGAVHVGIQSFPPALLVCLRFTLAGLLLILICALRGEGLPDTASLKRELLIGALLFFGGNSFISWAAIYVPTGLGATLIATNPFWMIGLAAVLPPREKVHPVSLVGLLIGFVGMLILLSPELLAPKTLSPAFWPCILGLLMMVFFWAAGSVAARKTSSRASLLMSVGLQNLFAGIMLMPVCALTVHSLAFKPSMASVEALAYLVLLGSMLTTPCYLYILKKLPVAVSSTFAYVTPVVAVIFGWLFLGETVTWITALGTGVILGGVILVQLVGRQEAPSRAGLPQCSAAERLPMGNDCLQTTG